MWNDLISIIPAVGALIVAALSLSSHLPRWRKWLIECLTAVMVVAAGWNQWSSTREESAERAVAETRQKHIAQLKSFYVEADNLFVKEITVANTKDVNGYKQLSAELDAYSKQLENWVHANMGSAAKEHLLRLPTAPPLTFSFAINQDQNSELNALISIRQSIDDLIANPTWDEAKRTQ